MSMRNSTFFYSGGGKLRWSRFVDGDGEVHLAAV